MANLINWRNLNEKSLYEQLKLKISECKELEKSYITEDFEPDEIEEEMEKLEVNFDIYNQKLEFIKKLDQLEDSKRKECMHNLVQIDSNDDLNEKNKLRMMLSYAVMTDYYKRINERTIDELLMLTACSMEFEVDGYEYYMEILSDEQVAASIVNKTSDLGEQIDVAYAIMDSQDEFGYDFVDADNYDELVNNGINVINNYSFGHTK